MSSFTTIRPLQEKNAEELMESAPSDLLGEAVPREENEIPEEQLPTAPEEPTTPSPPPLDEADLATLQQEIFENAKKQAHDPMFGYGREPVIPDQFHRFPQSVKEGPLQVKVFDLENPSDVEKYGKVMAAAYATETSSPTVKVQDYKMRETEDSWKVLVHYHELWYKKLIEKPST
jgi:hypothetical protein